MWNYITIAVKEFIIKYGLEKMGRYYSTYPGIVIDNDDPKKLGRLIINVPRVHGSDKPDNWAWPTMARGSWKIPEKGEPVRVMFEEGNPQHPVWNFGWYNKTEVLPKNADLDHQVWQTYSENIISLSNKDGSINIETKDGHKIDIVEDNILFTSKQGMKVTIDDIVKIANGSNGVLLSTESLVELKKVETIIDVFKQLLTTSIPEPGNGAPSAFQAALAAALGPLPNGSFTNSLVSEKLKIQ